jgi:hypothetical protein
MPKKPLANILNTTTGKAGTCPNSNTKNQQGMHL